MIAKCIKTEYESVEIGKEYKISRSQDFWAPYGPTVEPHCIVYPKSGKGNYLGIMPMSWFEQIEHMKVEQIEMELGEL